MYIATLWYLRARAGAVAQSFAVGSESDLSSNLRLAAVHRVRADHPATGRHVPLEGRAGSDQEKVA